MIKGIFLIHGFLVVILVLIQSTDANWFKTCFGGSCMPKEDQYERAGSPITKVSPPKQVPEIKKPDPVIVVKPDPVVVTPPVGNKPIGRTKVKKSESKTSPKTRKSPISSNGRQSGDDSPTGMSKSAIKKREAARSENILADLEVRVATGGKSTRTAKQAETFKATVTKKCKAKGTSETFVLTGESCANGMGNLYKK